MNRRVVGITNVIPANVTLSVDSGVFPILSVTIDEDGLVVVTPHPQYCSPGFSYLGTGDTFDFTLDTPVPPILALAPVPTDPSLGVALSLLDSDMFRLTASSGAGTTDINVTSAQP